MSLRPKKGVWLQRRVNFLKTKKVTNSKSNSNKLSVSLVCSGCYSPYGLQFLADSIKVSCMSRTFWQSRQWHTSVGTHQAEQLLRARWLWFLSPSSQWCPRRCYQTLSPRCCPHCCCWWDCGRRRWRWTWRWWMGTVDPYQKETLSGAWHLEELKMPS